MNKIFIFLIYLLIETQYSESSSIFAKYKERQERLKKEQNGYREEERPMGPPIIDVNWGNRTIPKNITVDVMRKILELVSNYKRYEYCPFAFGSNMTLCLDKSIDGIVEKIINNVVYPTEPPPPPTPPHNDNDDYDDESDDEDHGADDDDYGGEKEKGKDDTAESTTAEAAALNDDSQSEATTVAGEEETKATEPGADVEAAATEAPAE